MAAKDIPRARLAEPAWMQETIAGFAPHPRLYLRGFPRALLGALGRYSLPPGAGVFCFLDTSKKNDASDGLVFSTAGLHWHESVRMARYPGAWLPWREAASFAPKAAGENAVILSGRACGGTREITLLCPDARLCRLLLDIFDKLAEKRWRLPSPCAGSIHRALASLPAARDSGIEKLEELTAGFLEAAAGAFRAMQGLQGAPERLARLAAARAALGRDTLRVGVVGEACSGKSCLVNALLERRILPEDALPGTTCAPALLCRGAAALPGAKGPADTGCLRHKELFRHLPPGIGLLDTPAPGWPGSTAAAGRAEARLEPEAFFCDAWIVLSPLSRPLGRDVIEHVLRLAGPAARGCLFAGTFADRLCPDELDRAGRTFAARVRRAFGTAGPCFSVSAWRALAALEENGARAPDESAWLANLRAFRKQALRLLLRNARALRLLSACRLGARALDGMDAAFRAPGGTEDARAAPPQSGEILSLLPELAGALDAAGRGAADKLAWE